MLKTSLIYMIAFFLPLEVLCEHNKIDSLTAVLANSSDQIEQISTLKNLVGLVNGESRGQYLDQLDQIANNQQNDSLRASIYNYLGIQFYYLNDFVSSTAYYFKAMERTNSENLIMRVSLNSNIGWNFQKQNQFTKAITYYQSAEQLARRLGGKKTLGRVLNEIGVLHKNLGHYDLALQYLEESLTYNIAVGNKRFELFNINNIGVIYYNLAKYDQALEQYSNALEINYLRGDTLEIIHNLLNIGETFAIQKKYAMAIDTLMKCDEVMRRTDFLDERADVNKLLYEIYYSQEKFQDALRFFELAKILQDSLFRKGQLAQMMKLEGKYKLSQKEKDLQLSNNEVLRHKFNNSVLALVLVAALLIIFFLIQIFFIKRKSERKLSVLNEQIKVHHEKVISVNEQLERKVVSRTTVVQQQRDRLKKFTFTNSHNLRKPLTSILSLIDLIEHEKNEESKNEMIQMLRLSAQEMDTVIIKLSRQLEKEDY